MNVAHLLVGQADRRPDASAMIEGIGRRTRRISFAQLEAHSSSCGQFLLNAGLHAGDHVLVFVPMSIDLYVALIAIFRVGAVAMFLDPSAGPAHIDRCCEMIRPSAMIAVSKAHLLRLRSRALRKIPHLFAVGWPVPGAARWKRGYHCPATAPIVAREAGDPALITFTSGSTALPKAAVRSHGFLAAQHASLQRAIDLSAGEIDLATLPIFSLANLASGVTTVIPDADLRRPGAIDSPPILRQIIEHRITRCVASPAFFERLLEDPLAPQSLASMTRLYTGGAPVFPGLLERLQQAMPRAKVVAVYGSTEAEPIAHVARDEISAQDEANMLAGRGLLAGIPVADIDLRIIPNQWGQPIAPMSADQFAQIALPPNQAGEIVVHGEHVLRGYLNGRGDEQTKFRVEDQVWHRTSDAGCLDDRGRLWLMGRAEARIKDDRGTIYPFSVECAAGRIAGVRRSALIGQNRQRILCVELNASAAAVSDQDVQRTLAWVGIDRVIRLRQIPLDARHNAKIDYPALRKMVAQSMACAVPPLPRTRGRGLG